MYNNSTFENSTESLSFQVTQGITAEAIKKNKIVYTNIGYKDNAFRPFIDNVSRYLQIQNMICAPLYDENQEIVAVLQLINKVEGNIKDREIVLSLPERVGAVAVHIRDNDKARYVLQQGAGPDIGTARGD